MTIQAPKIFSRKTSGAVIALAVMTACLGGCVSTPPATMDEGISHIMTDAEQYAKDTLTQGGTNTAAICDSNGRKIQLTLGSDHGDKLTIDATVSVAKVKHITRFELAKRSTDEDLVKKILFGERAGQAVQISDPRGGHAWALDTQKDGSIQFTWITGKNGMTYLSCSWGTSAKADWSEPTDPDLPLPDTAASQGTLRSILQQFSVPDYSVISEESDPKSGLYRVRVLPQFTAFPVIADAGTNELDMLAINASFSTEGMRSLSWWNPMVVSEETNVSELLSVDQAIEVVQKDVGVKLKPRSDKKIDAISLRHQYVMNDYAKTIVARPVWYFHMEQGSPYSSQEGADFRDVHQGSSEQFDESFIVDAQTGALTVMAFS